MMKQLALLFMILFLFAGCCSCPDLSEINPPPNPGFLRGVKIGRDLYYLPVKKKSTQHTTKDGKKFRTIGYRIVRPTYAQFGYRIQREEWIIKTWKTIRSWKEKK